MDGRAAVNTYLMTSADTGRKPHPYIDIGHRIAERRRQLGRERGRRITQKQVADAVDVATGTVTAWEIGKQRPEGENLVKLAAFLETTPDQLIHGALTESGPATYARASMGAQLLRERSRQVYTKFMGELFAAGCDQEEMERASELLLAPIVARPDLSERMQEMALRSMMSVVRAEAGVEEAASGPNTEPGPEGEATSEASASERERVGKLWQGVQDRLQQQRGDETETGDQTPAERGEERPA